MRWCELLATDIERHAVDNGMRPLGRLGFVRVPAYPALLAVGLYRLGYALHRHGLGLLAQICHALSITLTGCDIHPCAEIGERLLIGHPVGIVVGRLARLGAGITLMQGVTIGRISPSVPEMPTIADGVYVGARATVLGPISVGAGGMIGANALVADSLPARAIVVAPRAQLIKIDGVRQFIPNESQTSDLEALRAELHRQQEELGELLDRLAGCPHLAGVASQSIAPELQLGASPAWSNSSSGAIPGSVSNACEQR